MKKNVFLILSIAAALLISACVIFAFSANKAKIEVLQSNEAVEYYVNGENDALRFGVAAEGNLFEPDEEIRVVLQCIDKSFDGKRAIVRIKSEQTGFSKWTELTLDEENPYNTLVFSSSENGIFNISISFSGMEKCGFTVGVLPKNKQAGDEFYYGIQPYITRAYTWGEGFCVPNFSAAESVDIILDTAEYLGVNLVREDSVGWGAMQSEPYGEVNFLTQDYLVDKVNARGMKYNWIFGFNAGKWSAAEKYKENYDEATGWTYPPDEAVWADFAGKVAVHYADNPHIFWEIWNEPNWHFFAGTPDEYFSFLEKTASVIKSVNPSAVVYSGGLAVAEKESNNIFYGKFAELIKDKLIDGFCYHNHDGLDNYYDYIKKMFTVTKEAGLSGGGFNSESGVGGADSATIACKALYTRSTGAVGFVSFAFRKTVTSENDINEFAFFNEYMQPTDTVIAYASVIRFLGNARFVKNVSDEKDLIIDEYTADGKKTEVYYSLGEKTKIAAPEGSYTAYDMYGNEIRVGRRLTVSNEPIYIVY